MPLPVAKLKFEDPAPQVKVTVPDAVAASYTISVVPPDRDVAQAFKIEKVEGEAAGAKHSLCSAWPLQPGCVVCVIGGVALPQGGARYSVQVELVDAKSNRTSFDVIQTQGSSAMTFVAMIQLSG